MIVRQRAPDARNCPTERKHKAGDVKVAPELHPCELVAVGEPNRRERAADDAAERVDAVERVQQQPGAEGEIRPPEQQQIQHVRPVVSPPQHVERQTLHFAAVQTEPLGAPQQHPPAGQKSGCDEEAERVEGQANRMEPRLGNVRNHGRVMTGGEAHRFRDVL